VYEYGTVVVPVAHMLSPGLVCLITSSRMVAFRLGYVERALISPTGAFFRRITEPPLDL
jgi:hypothetical protein